MKTKLIIIIALLSAFYSLAQTDGWFLYTKTNTISAIVPDHTNVDILHLATDIGYIQFNTNTGLVTDFLNLTSQNPAIGHVNGLDVNPTNTNIALALDDGIAIYDGTTVTIYNYDNSNLTMGSVGGSEFTKLKVRYGQQGELYIFKPDITGYQVFNAGVFDVEVVTAFRPQDIVENQAGTKVYFAGWNDGLWELDTAGKSNKASGAFVNYTSSNSDLIYNSLHALHVDSSDLLYIGGFQGLNTMTGAGAWNTYQQLDPAFGFSFLPVYNISLNESNGDLLIQTSTPNSSNFGLSTLELATNTWTNFTNDNTNCLNTNNFRASAIAGDGNIYASKSHTDNGSLFKFNHNSNACSEPDINYLNCPTVANSNLLSDFTVRTKASGNLDIGFTRGENLHILEIDPDTFNGTFGAATSITPSAGKSAYSLLNDNDFFIVETNTGWVFVDGNNNTTEFAHSLPSYFAIATKKVAAYDSEDGIINLVHKGFDASWNYRLYKTQCNTATSSCSTSEEIFTTNRDFTKNIYFGTNLNSVTNQASVFAIKTESAGARNSFNVSGQGVSGSQVDWATKPEGFGVGIGGTVQLGGVPLFDPLFLQSSSSIINAFWAFTNNIQVRTTTSNPKTEVVTTFPFEGKILSIGEVYLLTRETAVSLIIRLGLNSTSTKSLLSRINNNVNVTPKDLVVTSIEIESIDAAGVPLLKTTNILGAKIDNSLPDDLFIANIKCVNYSITEAVFTLSTNYGMLIKTGIDISNLALSTKDNVINNKAILLYPNPANDIVSFLNKTIKNIEIYDINGRSVLKQQGTSFSVKTLAQGLYIVKATNTDNITVTKKLIVD